MKNSEDLILAKVDDLNSSRARYQAIELSRISYEEFITRINAMSQWLNKNIDPKLLKPILTEYISICKIIPDISEIKILWKMIKTKDFSNKEFLQIDDIRSLLTEWYHESHSSQDLRIKLMKTIRNYEKLKEDLMSIDEKNNLESLIYSLRIQLKKIPSKSMNFVNNFLDKSKEGLSEIFKHYSKQQFLIGKSPTFDNIQKNLEILTFGKFIKFSKDFKIVDKTKKDKKSKKIFKFIEKVFKENSDFNKEMHEHQFFAAVDALALFLLDAEYDEKNHTNWKDIPQEEKILKFYEILGLHESTMYSKKMKDSIPHFGAESYSRIPENDWSKRYKFNPEKFANLKSNIEEWKSRKTEEQQSEKNANIHSKKNSMRGNNRESNIRIKELSAPQKSSSKNTFYGKQTYSKIHGKNDDSIKETKIENFEQVNRKPLTLKKLSEMHQEELLKADKDFYVGDLITENSSDDENFSKLLYKNSSMPANKRGLSKNTSENILNRGKELEQQHKRQENERIQNILKISDGYFDKSSAYLRKHN